VGVELAAFMRRYEPIKQAMTTIEENVSSVKALEARNKTTATERQRKGTLAQTLGPYMDAKHAVSECRVQCFATHRV